MGGSRIAMPFLYVNLGCEYVFLLNDRVRAQSALPPRKAAEVVVDCIMALFEDSLLDRAFTRRRPYSLVEVEKFFFLVSQSPSLRISETSLNKLFTIICMITKAHILRLRTPDDMQCFTDRHLDEIHRVLEGSSIGAEACDAVESTRQRFHEWYERLSCGEFQRLRMTLLSQMSAVHTAVHELIRRELQHVSGHLIAPTRGQPVDALGACSVYSSDDSIRAVDVLSVAGKNTVDAPLVLGANIYLSEEEQERAPLTRRLRGEDVASPAAKPDSAAFRGGDANDHSGSEEQQGDVWELLNSVKRGDTGEEE